MMKDPRERPAAPVSGGDPPPAATEAEQARHEKTVMSMDALPEQSSGRDVRIVAVSGTARRAAPKSLLLNVDIFADDFESEGPEAADWNAEDPAAWIESATGGSAFETTSGGGVSEAASAGGSASETASGGGSAPGKATGGGKSNATAFRAASSPTPQAAPDGRKISTEPASTPPEGEKRDAEARFQLGIDDAQPHSDIYRVKREFDAFLRRPSEQGANSRGTVPGRAIGPGNGPRMGSGFGQGRGPARENSGGCMSAAGMTGNRGGLRGAGARDGTAQSGPNRPWKADAPRAAAARGTFGSLSARSDERSGPDRGSGGIDSTSMSIRSCEGVHGGKNRSDRSDVTRSGLADSTTVTMAADSGRYRSRGAATGIGGKPASGLKGCGGDSRGSREISMRNAVTRLACAGEYRRGAGDAAEWMRAGDPMKGAADGAADPARRARNGEKEGSGARQSGILGQSGADPSAARGWMSETEALRRMMSLRGWSCGGVGESAGMKKRSGFEDLSNRTDGVRKSRDAMREAKPRSGGSAMEMSMEPAADRKREGFGMNL